MGSIACSSDQAPGGMAQKLRRLFQQKNLNAQIVIPGVSNCIAEAQNVHELRMVQHVMNDYKSSNFGPTRTKALALEDGSAFVASSRDESGGAPQSIDKLLTEKEQELKASLEKESAL